jgi:hypothetical protein
VRPVVRRACCSLVSLLTVPLSPQSESVPRLGGCGYRADRRFEL